MSDLLGVTGILLNISYAGKEFLRVGYYVYNYYQDPELVANPPEFPIMDKLFRNVLTDKPRITNFDIFTQDKSGKIKTITDDSFQAINSRHIKKQLEQGESMKEEMSSQEAVAAAREEEKEESGEQIKGESEEDSRIDENTNMEIESLEPQEDMKEKCLINVLDN